MGFLSRLLPVSYSYSKLVIARILRYITEEKHLQNEEEVLNLPSSPVEVKLEPSLAKELVLDAVVLAKAQRLYGFRLQSQLQTLAKGRALLEGRDKVIKEDVDEIRSLLVYANFDHRPVGGILPVYGPDDYFPFSELEGFPP